MSQHPIAEYFNRINVYPEAALSQDGKRLAFLSSVTGSPQVWLGEVPEEGLLRYPKPFTGEKEKQPAIMESSLRWIGNDQLACLMDRHGDEQTFIEIHDLKTGEIRAIPSEKGAREALGFVSKDRKTLYFTSNRGNLAAQGLYAYDLRSGRVKKLHHHATASAGWLNGLTHRGHLLFYRSTATYSNTLHAVHPQTGRVLDLFLEEGTLLMPVANAPGGKLLVISNRGRQFLGLAVFDVAKQTLDYLGPDRWDIEEAKLSPDGKTLFTLRNVAGQSKAEVFSYPSMRKIPVRLLTDGWMESVSFSKNGRFAVLTASSPAAPRDFFRLDLKTRKVSQLTDNWTSRVPRDSFVKPKLVRYPSGAREIYSFLFLPKGAKANQKLPVVIWPHGGPQWQERATFRPIFQYIVSRGFALWAPNHTGSTGFGKDFTNAICGAWGTADLPDMENGIAWLKKSGWVDPQKICIMGGSYGGYMTLRALTKIPGTFRAAVDIFGVSNLLTFVKSVPPDWAPFMDRLVGNAEKDQERLREQSPIFALDKIDCPLLVIQGAKDPRVVQAESDQVVDTLKKQGKPVEYLLFEDEGHGFLKLENELKAFTAAAEFLERALK